MIKTTTEKRADGRIFAGSDPVYTQQVQWYQCCHAFTDATDAG